MRILDEVGPTMNRYSTAFAKALRIGCARHVKALWPALEINVKVLDGHVGPIMKPSVA